MLNLFKNRFFKGKYLLFILLLVATILPRFLFLNSVPAAINNDEMHYALNAKSFALTGKDTTGKITPLDILLFKYPGGGEMIQAELPYFLEMPIFGPLNFSLTGLAIPNALFGVLTVVMIFLITRKLFDEKTAYVAAIVAALNPWLIFVSRTSYEAGIAIPFFLGIIYILLVAKGWKILLTIPIALLAFYSYIGTKLIFLPFMLLVILYVYFYVNKKKYFKQYLMVFLFALFLTGFFFFQFKQQNSVRSSDLIMPNSPVIASAVDNARKNTISSPLMSTMQNKYTVYFSVLTKNAFNAFSPTYLFVSGDYFFMVGEHGIFYWIDAIFLGIGVFFIFAKNKKLFAFLALLILLSAVPQIVHSDSYRAGNFTPHITLMIPFLVIMIGFGIITLLNLVRNRKSLYILATIIGIGYFALFLSFTYVYFLKFPLQDATFTMYSRNLSRYLNLAQNNDTPIVILTVDPKIIFKQFLFYSNAYNKNTINQLNHALSENRLTYKNISFLSCNSNLKIPSNTLLIDDAICGRPPTKGAVNIVQVKDSGAVYRIYNDKICSRYALPHFIWGLRLPELAVENLSQENFCKRFIIAY